MNPKQRQHRRHHQHQKEEGNDEHDNNNEYHGTSAINILKSTMKEATNPTVSRFSEWDTDRLKRFLVMNNIVIRGSANASHETLLRICNEVFGPDGCSEGDDDYNLEECESKQQDIGFKLNGSFTIENLTVMNWAALIIQRSYIASRSKKSCHMVSQQTQDYDHYDYESNDISINHNNEEEYKDGQPIHLRDENNNTSVLSGNDDEMKFQDVSLNEEDDIYVDCEEAIVEKSQYSDVHDVADYKYDDDSLSDDEISSVESADEYLDEELQTEWRKPSWKYAKKFEAENRPHESGRALERYDWRKVTLGRHCTMGGCGEQLDLWDEGATSEFSQFGSGITNYFKFLKWCCWIMLILSLIHTPALIINILSASSGMEYKSTLAMTTLGNLGNAKDVNTIALTGCNEDIYHFDTCRIKKNELAFLYGLIDFVGTLVVIIGWVWLIVFQRREVDHLNRTTVDASDYTVRVLGIPPRTKERELAAHFAHITNEAVAEVNLAFKSAKAIQHYRMRGKIMKERIKCVQRIRYESSYNKAEVLERRRRRKIKKLLKERRKLTEQITLIDDVRKGNTKKSYDAIQAFVTFDTETGFLNAISSYQINWIRSFFFYPKHLFFGGNKLKLLQAPEPSTIIWENLEFSATSRFCRKCLTTFIASLAVLMSIYFTFLAKDFREELVKSMNAVCPDYLSGLTNSELRLLAEQNRSISHCYCSTLQPSEQWNEPMCVEYVKGAFKASAMNYGAGFMVCFMNMFFTLLMDRAGSFEKHESIDAMESSNMTRVFLLRFLNSGCLVLLYNINLIQAILGVRFEDPHNFNVEWFGTGGVSIIIVMCINVITPHIGSFIQYRRHRGKIRKLESKGLTEDNETKDEFKIWYTQEELNEVYLGPQFCLNYRYTQSLVNFFICWMYSISMPVLPFIGALSFYISFWVDKYLFCNFYRIPPKYSDDIGSRSTSLIGYGIILHIIMSCWILGSNQIFSGRLLYDGDRFGDSYIVKFMMKRHIIPLECLGLIFIVGFIMRRSLMTFSKTLSKIVRCLICSSGTNIKELKRVMNAVQVRYSAARLRGVIKGLASYNILQNPKYQDAFAISPEFAMTHHRLSSIRGYNTKEGELCIAKESEHSSNTTTTL